MDATPATPLPNDATPKLSREQFIAAMRAQVEALLGQVADAVNDAPPGYIIAGSEEQVRDAFARFRQASYEQAVQMRLDAAEAAFPPSGGRDHATQETP